MNFHLKKTKIDGLNVITIKRRSDFRGYLDRLFCERELNSFLNKKKIVQINRTFTKKKVLFGVYIIKSHLSKKLNL